MKRTFDARAEYTPKRDVRDHDELLDLIEHPSRRSVLYPLIGARRAGKTWTLRSVEATNQDGSPISEQLKTFADLKGTVEVDVERQEHEKYGVSFLLKPISNGGGGARGGDSGLAARVERLESEVRRLSSIVDRREPSAEPFPGPPATQSDF